MPKYFEIPFAWLHPRTISVVLLLVGCLVFANSIPNGYAIDDERITNGNELTGLGLKAIPKILSSPYLKNGPHRGSWRPIPRITYAIEYAIVGFNPQVSHTVQLILHLSLCLLIFFVVQRLFPKASPLLAPITALLFLLHPIHTEVINNLKSRDELMAMTFNMGALLFALRYIEGKSKLIWVGVAFFFALCCKESAHGFLPIIPIAMFFKSEGKHRKILKVSLILLGAIGVYWSSVLSVMDSDTAFWMAVNKDGFPYMEHPLLHEDSLSIRLGTAFNGLLSYLKLMVFPWPLSLFYGFDTVELVNFWHWKSVLSLFLYLGLGGFAVWKFRNRHPLSFAIFSFLFTLFMFSNLLFPLSGIIADRFAFASSFGFCLATGYLLSRSKKKNKTILLVNLWFTMAAVVLLLAFATGTFLRNFAWKDTFTLAVTDVTAHPDSATLHSLAFQLYLEKARLAGTESERREANEKVVFHLQELARIYPVAGGKFYFLAGKITLEQLDSPLQAKELFNRSLNSLAEFPAIEPKDKDYFIDKNLVIQAITDLP